MKKSNFFKKVCMALLAITLVATSIETSGMNVQAATKKVTLSTTKQTINVGKTFKLSVKSVTGLKSKKVVFSTSNAKVATVSTSKAATSCTIKGISKGKVTITAKSTVSSKVIAKCTVTVNQLVTSFSLNQTAYALASGKSVTLKATGFLPSNANSKAVTWKSSNTSIATVSSSGKVTAKKAGKVKITATTKDGSKKSASCTITVVKDSKKLVKVSSVSMTPASATINVGASTKLSASVAPSKATMKTLFWTSSNSSIATVDQKGNVKAVKAGSVTITATAQDGSKKKATCAVTVVVPVAGISLNSSSLELKEGNSAALTATIAPADATDKTVTWESSNTAVATVANGTVTAVAAGTAAITAKASNGMAVSCAVTVTSAYTPVASVSLNMTTNKVVKSSTFQLMATIAPGEATNKTVTFTSSDESKVTVDATTGLVTAVKASAVPVVITATAADGKTATCTVNVTGEENAFAETASAYVFTVDKAASEYRLAKDSDSKVISTTEADSLLDIYRNIVNNKLLMYNTQAEKLEAVWGAITKENIEQNQSIVTATVASSTVGANRIKVVTLSAYGRTRTMTLKAPLTFSANAAENQITVIEGNGTDLANTRSITLKNIAVVAEGVNNIVTFTVDAQKADGTVTAGKDFKAVIANDTKSATLYRVIAGVDENVASYVESDTAYTATIQKAFYDDVVSTLDITRTITDATIYNVYK